jgi:hypothetical protein
MKRNRNAFLLIAVLIGAALWFGWPGHQHGPRAQSQLKSYVKSPGAGDSAPYRPKAPGSLTFSRDIAPIIFTNCASCHRPGEAAPFSLLSYQDVKKRAAQVAYITEQRIMPPWKAEHGDYEFKNERRLTAEQIGMISQWVNEGAPEGDPKTLPASLAKKEWSSKESWPLGQPDLIVKMSEAYHVPADGPDIYRSFALPLNLPEDKWVKAIAFRPGARAVVHHSLFFYDATGNARKQDEADPAPGFSGGMGGFARGASGGGGLRRVFGDPSMGGASPVGSLGGWALGAQARALPEGLAWRLPKGADLIFSTHFHPSGKPEDELSTVGLYFTEKPPTKKFTGLQLPPLFGVLKGIDIPAGAREYTIEDSFTLPVDVTAFGVGAHAHYLAKQMLLTAQLPGGETKTLLWIKDWDFAWQDQYQFKEFVSLPKGTRLDVKIIYDNSAENPRNPSSPPKRVLWGEGSNDEMGSMSLQVVAANESEMPQLQETYRRHLQSAFLRPRGLISLWRQKH